MTTPSAGQVADRLTAYADSIRKAGAIRTHAVHAAFATVPRHRFLPHFRYRADEYVLDTSEEPPNEVLGIVYATTRCSPIPATTATPHPAAPPRRSWRRCSKRST